VDIRLVEKVTFQTNGTNTSGTGVDISTNLTYWQPLRDIVIVDLVQPSCGTIANDADWQIWANGAQTKFFFQAEEINPAYKGAKSAVAPTGIKVKAGTVLQFKWLGQSSAASNYLHVFFEYLR
jgi:hypothetical protein